MRNRILYAEDNESLRNSMGRALGLLEGCEIEIFEDGNSLDGRLKSDVSDVRFVVTDNDMPGKEGSEIITECAPRDAYSGIQFILYSATTPEIVDKVERAGAVYINKGKHNFLDVCDYLSERMNAILSSQ